MLIETFSNFSFLPDLNVIHTILRIPSSRSRLMWCDEEKTSDLFDSNPDVIQTILRIPSSQSRLMWCDDDILLTFLAISQ